MQIQVLDNIYITDAIKPGIPTGPDSAFQILGILGAEPMQFPCQYQFLLENCGVHNCIFFMVR